ncbi:MAG: SDR family NAD(P)-dependent oxidoreductase [Hyphomicrobiaceae bacterium]|nr:SDR family NAD(P)-dependent oxidoreductase [Hyphomicrobiaceae bacterium]
MNDQPKPNHVPTRRGRLATIVTGGSRGIGLALARRFLDDGHNVVVIARGKAGLDQAVAVLRAEARQGQSVVPLVLDVTRADACQTIDETLAGNGLEPGILINNAGVGLGGTLTTQSADDLSHLVALNVDALTRLTRHMLIRMRDNGGGTIINVSSLGGYVPGPYQAAYYASKAYVNAFTEAAGWEASGSGVNVMLVAPGPVETGFHAAMGAEKSLYRRLLPGMSPAAIANSVHLGYRLGLRVVVPGPHFRLMSLALRILPHPIALPLIGFLLKPRGTAGSR